MGKEQGSDYYDSAFLKDALYQGHYKNSRYFPMWKETLRYIPKDMPLFEVGCGPGQFAAMLFDNGYNDYHGIDFSPVAVRKAEETTGRSVFSIQNAYDVIIPKGCFVICYETLEHIDDKRFLKRVPSKTPILLTVPSFDSAAHVRHFKSKNSVLDHYSDAIDIEFIKQFDRWFIAKGTLQ